LLSGYRGGVLDAVLMRIADATMAFPLILLALLLVIVLGPSFINVIIGDWVDVMGSLCSRY